LVLAHLFILFDGMLELVDVVNYFGKMHDITTLISLSLFDLQHEWVMN